MEFDTKTDRLYLHDFLLAESDEFAIARSELLLAKAGGELETQWKGNVVSESRYQATVAKW
jgi:hypothetical protein